MADRVRYPRRLGEPYPPKPCEWCKKDFIPPRRDSRFCSTEHSRAWAWRERYAIEAKNRKYPACGKCGGEIVQSMRGRGRKYCHSCTDRAPQGPKRCEFCDREFVPANKRGPQARHCSPKCKSARARAGRAVPRYCAQCGDVLGKGRKKFCSDRCAYQSHRIGFPVTNCETCGVELVSGSSQPMRFCDDHRPPKSMACKIRRERMRDGEDIDHQAVYERDGWICGICGAAVDPELSYPEVMAASLDHIVPLSAGGPHTYGNVQCAHWLCNCQKHAKDDAGLADAAGEVVVAAPAAVGPRGGV